MAQLPGVGFPPGAATDVAGAVNLDFEAAGPGRMLADWFLAQESRLLGYSMEMRTTGCRTGRGCAVIVAGPAVESGSAGALLQGFDATRYREKTMRLRAWVRLEGGRRGDRIHVLFMIDGEKRSAEYVQKRGVNAAEWTLAEVTGKVPKDASEIHIGIIASGKGTAWVDDVAFEPVTE